MLKLSINLIFSIFFTLLVFVKAQILISPIRGVINVKDNKLQQIFTVSNTSTKFLQLNAKFIDLKATPRGIYTKPNIEWRRKNSALSYLAIEPVFLSLAPGEIGLFTVSAVNIDNYFIEKRSHLLIQAKVNDNIIKASSAVKADIITGVSVPILLRNAFVSNDASNNIAINNMAIKRNNEKYFLSFVLNKKQRLDYSLNGSIEIFHSNNKIKPFIEMNINFFKEVDSKIINIQINPKDIYNQKLEIYFKGRKEFLGQTFSSTVINIGN